MRFSIWPRAEMVFSRMASALVSPWRMMSSLPEMTKDAAASLAGTVNENAWKDGSPGGSISGQTLIRATGLIVPSKSFQRESVVT